MSKNKIMQRLSIDKQHELVFYLVASSANVFAFLPKNNQPCIARMAQRHPEASVKRRLMTTESQKQRPYKYIYTQRSDILQGENILGVAGKDRKKICHRQEKEELLS